MSKLTLLSLLTIACVTGIVEGWSTIRKENMIHMAKNSLFACGISCLLPLSCLATQGPEYSCPQSFASQSLGIQNVVQVPNPSLRPASIGSLFCPTSTTTTAADTNLLLFDSSIQGVIYLPSSAGKDRLLPTTDGSLVVTIASVDKPAIVLARAQIPMSQISSFPINFSLSKTNMLSPPPVADQLEVEWDNRVLYLPYDLVVTAKVTGSSLSSFRGQGYSKLLQLPYGDDFRVVRAAASIRLAEPTSPDPLFVW